MKLAYRIITPIFAVAAAALGLFVKLFYFAIGSADEQLSQLVQLIQLFKVPTEFEYSAFEIIKMLVGAKPSGTPTEDGSGTFLAVAEPVLPHIIAFVVFFVLTILLFLAVGAVAGATGNRKAVIFMSAAGLVLCFVCIVISRLAFDKIIGGEINLSDIVGVFSDNTWAQLLTTVVSVTKATLSGGFYAVFGMYILVIIWTIFSNMLIKTPIQVQKKHRRKKPIKKLSAYFQK